MFDREPREKVRLYLHKAKPLNWKFEEPHHKIRNDLKIQPSQIHGYFSLFGIPPQEESQRCIVDVGAMLTLMPKKVWKPYQHQISWLQTTETALQDTAVSGRKVHFRLGLVTMQFLDFDQRVMSRQVIAGCVRKPISFPETVLGLGFGDAIISGGLCLNFVDDSLWLVTV